MKRYPFQAGYFASVSDIRSNGYISSHQNIYFLPTEFSVEKFQLSKAFLNRHVTLSKSIDFAMEVIVPSCLAPLNSSYINMKM